MGNIFLGKNQVNTEKKEVEGQFIIIENEKFYQIKNYDAMQPFFISLASDSNHWLYIASTGGLTAGRKNPDLALFPYYTDDKISESAGITGSKTILQVQKSGFVYLWEPFSDNNRGIYQIERTIAKSISGNKLIFSEKNTDLGLTFSYAWMNADDFGWVKKSKLTNDNPYSLDVKIVDGLQNILPSGIDKFTQNTFSTLVDGYKKTELIDNSTLALYRMEAILVDRAEPSESLRVNSVWSAGLENADFLLSSSQLNNFRAGVDIVPEYEAKGVRGAYLACANLNLSPGSIKSWYFVAEVNQDAVQINNLLYLIQNTENIQTLIEKNIAAGTQNLLGIVAQADGIQLTSDENNMARHFSNVLFNTMRGGIYTDNYTVYADDFRKHLSCFNKKLVEKHTEFLSKLQDSISYTQLEVLIKATDDLQLYRLFQEYLPLTFSRRHGDPSRPWNLFNINVKDETGKKILSYQGNWRDIFQNWEALSMSYPAYINGIIAKFLNATTADGYNPYKVTSEGIDWEIIEPENPWSNIGYWGDHQIIYLLKLMEVSYSHYPEALVSMLNKQIFACANVPYRIKTYNEIVANPKNTISFDAQLHHRIEELEKSYGADARLLMDENLEVRLVSFTEKLFATLLAKISNFVPGAGIWMNTLRPEWNDANNALVGSGASMVTLCYMRRFVAFARELYHQSSEENFPVNKAMKDFFDEITVLFQSNIAALEQGFDNFTRRKFTNQAGITGEHYRSVIYNSIPSEKGCISKDEIISFFDLALLYFDHSIETNKRPDKLYHAYNLVKFSDNQIEIRNLYEMLEGQVAVLSSGKLSADEVVEVLKALRNSSLYRADQNSYMLYPDKKLPSFLEKNNINPDEILRIKILGELIAKGDKRIITTDLKGQVHFNASFNNADFLHQALLNLKSEGKFKNTDIDIQAIKDVYEKVFDHQSFTGRSGTFYKYEGLGCIYWHMVSKLLLAIAENIQWAYTKKVDVKIIEELKHYFADVKAGIGAHKSPVEYGSFHFDPYSHTPTMAGVQQPGMTGQVKEDILTRYFELGLEVKNGCLEIKPENINPAEFIAPVEESGAPYLSFTYCSVPFIYQKDGKSGFEICYTDKSKVLSEEYLLSRKTSDEIFNRNTGIQQVIVHI